MIGRRQVSDWPDGADPISTASVRSEARVEVSMVFGARLFARLNSPLAPVVEISRDQWKNFRIVDWQTGEAVCLTTGDRLFSIHRTWQPRTKKMRAATAEDHQYLLDIIAKRTTGGGQKPARRELLELLAARGLSRETASLLIGSLPSNLRRKRGERSL